MSAHTVIRVKRRRCEAPLDALLVACKKQKCEENNTEDTVTTLVKLAGTFEKLDDTSLSSTLENVKAAKKLRDDKLQHVPDVKEKLRQDLANKWKEKRYEVVNKFRSELSTELAAGSPMTVLDIESKVTESEDEDFLYDVYYTTDIFDGVMDSLLSVQPVDLVNAELEEEEAEDNMSEDSNDENNWRNDYPDEDEEKDFDSAESEDENNFGWTKTRRKKETDDEDSENSLSSEEFDDDYLYGQSKKIDGLVDRWHDALGPTDSEGEEGEASI